MIYSTKYYLSSTRPVSSYEFDRLNDRHAVSLAQEMLKRGDIRVHSHQEAHEDGVKVELSVVATNPLKFAALIGTLNALAGVNGGMVNIKAIEKAIYKTFDRGKSHDI